MRKYNLGDITYRYATVDDLIDLYGQAPKEMTRAFVFLRGGKIVAIGGIKRERGRMIAFSEIKPDANLSKIAIGRMAYIVMDMIRTVQLPVWAVAEVKGDDTGKLIKHFGFVQQASNNDVEIYTLWPTP